jgi:hypothetical protein
MQPFDVFDLDQDELALAWPLIRTCLPHLELSGWTTMAEALMDRGGGVIGIAPPGQCLHGVATYEVVETPRFGRVLNIEALAAFELSGRARARRLLVETLRRLTAELGCSQMVIASHKRPRPLQS